MYKCFTITDEVREGVMVITHKLKNEKLIPVIKTGKYPAQIVPVRLTKKSYSEWKQNGRIIIKYLSTFEHEGRLRYQEELEQGTLDRCFIHSKTRVSINGKNIISGNKTEDFKSVKELTNLFFQIGYSKHGNGTATQFTMLLENNEVLRIADISDKGVQNITYFKYSNNKVGVLK